MTLHEYLASPQAVDDVKALLASEPVAGTLRTHRVAACMWNARESGQWTRVEMWRSDAGRVEFLNCYFRPEEDVLIVSDCGEGVSDVMRRTGKRFIAAAEALQRTVPTMFDVSRTKSVATPSELPAMIVAVLSAVARSREAS